MTEIMPVPRNSNITVLRPPSITSGFFVKSEVSVLFNKSILTNVDIIVIINIATSVDILFLKERYYVGYKTYDNRCGI